MKLPSLTRYLPSWKNAALAILSALLLIFAFPDFELWFLAWFGLAPLFWAIEQEKDSVARSFVLGWLWGFIFFTGTCWWLTFAPITYAGFPWPVAYFLLFCLTAIVGIFPGIFAAICSVLLKRFGSIAILAAPFVWVFTEFLRYWLTGNNWNAIGYSQAFTGRSLEAAAYGGVLMIGFFVVVPGALVIFFARGWNGWRKNEALADGFGALVSKSYPATDRNLAGRVRHGTAGYFLILALIFFTASLFAYYLVGGWPQPEANAQSESLASIVAIQPNVPMAGLSLEKWNRLREKHVELAESELNKLTADNRPPVTVIFPESPMNFAYNDDDEFQQFVHAFAAKHDVNVLFNSAEPDAASDKYFNSAVLVGADGKEIAQYDKIYLVPFGESVPAPLQSIVPAFVGSFSYGSEYDLLPLGDAKAGVMICFESHFGELGREYVHNGADVIIEMTNDGYLGPTPVLRQHLANAVFRAVETNRPVLRVTNVGITAYINPRGEVLEVSEPYTEATRVWSVAKSDGSQTFYVRYGDWFAWLCSIVTIGLIGFGIVRGRGQYRLRQQSVES
ncbi:MAG: apolipoprotein N-acyltransferase [Blastocatellia bacterium]|nr:apolipoprotein N-acyltransferase [Blastocatellia bacterium]